MDRIDILNIQEMFEYTLGIDFYIEIPSALANKLNLGFNV